MTSIIRRHSEMSQPSTAPSSITPALLIRLWSAAELALDLGHRGLDLAVVGDVDLDRQRLSPVGLDPLRQVGQAVGAAGEQRDL